MTRILLDQNLSFKISKGIRETFPDTKHVSDLSLTGAPDLDIWNHAKNHNYCIMTFDSDYIDISVLNGFPPKIIWLRIGNTSTGDIIEIIKSNHLAIKDFLLDAENAYLEIN
jgi:predicted nuclease of predicted toxin-antitoxin system